MKRKHFDLARPGRKAVERSDDLFVNLKIFGVAVSKICYT